ncbi:MULTISPECIES: mechanosensitive ion channel family protein [unclassified Desulfurobacterium]|uniref:mechanosensitive ion channel family protein n=1 Tax=Desulfurobacterium sp. TC5-1 TaxID=1158318 RepID=UPI0003B4682F|nr:mechanosensitive ion channel domain-containing protein [Desulfurobacterium sp. TC5-1]
MLFFHRNEITGGDIYLIAFTLSLLAFIQLIKVLVQKRIENRFLKALVESLSGILFFVAGFSLSKVVSSHILKLIFEDFSILIGSVYLTRAVFIAEQASSFPRIMTFFFLVCAFLTSTLSHLNILRLDENVLYFIKKFFVVLSFLPLIGTLSSLLKGTLRSIAFTALLVFYITVSALWLSGFIAFDMKALIGIGLVAIVSLFYSFLETRGMEYAFTYFEKHFFRKRDALILIKNLRLFVTLLFIVVLKAILEQFFGIDKFFKILKNVYFIETDLLRISLYNIVLSVYYAFLLISLLNIFKKLVKLYFPKERRSIEGGSAEALIFNIGILFVFIVVLSSLGITWKVLLPVAGTLGVGIGFGLQTIMNNYLSGFILLFSKKLKIGDIVELPISVPTLGNRDRNVFGKIEDIGILSTLIRTNDGVEIAIPNSNFISSPIVNFSHHDPLVRLRIPIGVAYSSAPETVRKVILSVLEKMPGVLKAPRPSVWFWELGDSALIFIASFWIDIRRDIKIEEIRSRFYYNVWRELKKAGVEIPFPQNDIWFKNSLKVEIEKFEKGEDS